MQLNSSGDWCADCGRPVSTDARSHVAICINNRVRRRWSTLKVWRDSSDSDIHRIGHIDHGGP